MYNTFFLLHSTVGSAWSFVFLYPRHNSQWSLTSKNFLSQMLSITFFCLILALEKEPVFPFYLMLSAKQRKYWYHFYNVFGMTRSLTWDCPKETTNMTRPHRISKKKINLMFVDEHILNLSVLVWFPAMWCRYLYQYQWNGCMCRVSCRLILSTCGTRQCYSQCSGLSSWLLLPWRWDLTLPWFQDDRELTHGGNLFEKDCERLPSLWIVIAKKKHCNLLYLFILIFLIYSYYFPFLWWFTFNIKLFVLYPFSKYWFPLAGIFSVSIKFPAFIIQLLTYSPVPSIFLTRYWFWLAGMSSGYLQRPDRAHQWDTVYRLWCGVILWHHGSYYSGRRLHSRYDNI